jgi:hypothetical protein
MRKYLFALPAATAVLALGATGAPAQAHGHSTGHGVGHGAGHGVAAKPLKGYRNYGGGKSTYLFAALNGANEVPGPAPVGDKDGKAFAFVKVKGNRITYGFSWKGITAPTLGHIHQGAAGVNGPVKVTLFGTPMPGTATAAVGAASIEDPALAKQLTSDPKGFYLNLHTTEFGGGAVRGQLKRASAPVNPLSVIRGGGFRGFADGEQEVPVAPDTTAGDLDGHASAFIRTNNNAVQYSLAWVGIAAPTLGHIHQGKTGVNGPVKITLFDTPVPANVFALAGTVTTPPAGTVPALRKSPKDFYVNLHNTEFKNGALRGQLAK